MNGNIILLALVLGPMAAAIVSYIIGTKSKEARNYFADIVTAAEFAAVLSLMVYSLKGLAAEGEFPAMYFSWDGICGMGLKLQLDGFRVLYGLVAAFMWMMTTIFSRQYFAHYRNRNRYYMFMLLTLGATVGVFLSADLFTTFIFFEIMSFTSYVWVIHDEKPGAMKAGGTYLTVAVLGGMVMLMGLFLLYDACGTLTIDALLPAVKAVWAEKSGVLYIAGGLMVFGFGAKAGMFPLHIWLPKAHPVAPAPASALLSGILTKSGVFGVLAVTSNIFLHDPNWGLVMEFLGVITMFCGALLAVFSVDLKRTLACSSMSQIGFILVGVGMQCLLGPENALAVRGTLLHMVNHSLIKLDLFMVAGVVYMNLHKLDLNEIRGFGKGKPLLMFCYLMGALGIGGIPLWNGYVSKTLLHEAIVEYAEEVLQACEHAAASAHIMGTFGLWKTVEWIFLISGGMTVAYMLKLFICLFIEDNADESKQKAFREKTNYWNLQSKFAIVGSAAVLPVMGMLPYKIMNKMADLGQEFMHGEAPEHSVHYFNFTNLKGGLISICIGLAIYFGIIRTCLMARDEKGRKVYVNRWPAWLDLEELLYRPVLMKFLPWLCGSICGFFDKYIIDGPLKLFMLVSALFCRLADNISDFIILFARKTTHKQMGAESHSVNRDVLAYEFGTMEDLFSELVDKLTGHKGREHKSHIPGLVEFEEKTSRTAHIIGGSLAFSLLLVSLGMITVLLYMLLANR